MIVCHCFGVTDRQIRQACGSGSMSGCAAASGCGACEAAVLEIIEQHSGRRPDADGKQLRSHGSEAGSDRGTLSARDK